MRIEVIGNCILFLADCRDVIPMIGNVDALLTDPPYGIGWDKKAAKDSGRLTGKARKGVYEETGWDALPASKDILDSVRDVSKYQIIFGGNYFDLPPSRCWLVWDKENGTTDFADCELVWTNLKKSVRLIKWQWNGFIRKNQEVRVGHPTQKPVGVMQWCLGNLPIKTGKVFDPFMGSGSTGVACVKEGFSFIGVEQHEPYFEMAVQRIRNEVKHAVKNSHS